MTSRALGRNYIASFLVEFPFKMLIDARKSLSHYVYRSINNCDDVYAVVEF